MTAPAMTPHEAGAWKIAALVREDLAPRLGTYAPDAPDAMAWMAGFAMISTACITAQGADLATAKTHQCFVRHLSQQLRSLPPAMVSGSLAQRILSEAATLSDGLLILMQPAGNA